MFPFACAPVVDAITPEGWVVSGLFLNSFFASLICFLVKVGADAGVESALSVAVNLELLSDSSEPKLSMAGCFNTPTEGSVMHR